MESPLRYTIEIVADESEFPALDYAGARIAGPGNYLLIHPPVDSAGTPIDGRTPVLEIEVNADSTSRARDLVIDLYGKMRAESNLEPKEPEILLVYSTELEVPPLHFFIEEADELFDQQRFEAAIITAQIACEICVRTRIEKYAETEGNDLARLALNSINFSLMGRSADVFTAVFGFPPTRATCWSEYRTHVQRRNAIVHSGLRASREDAVASIDAMYAIRDFIDRCQPI